MQQSYGFCTDRNLRITSWDEIISHVTGIKSSEAIGKKYYEVFPRILSKDKDALSLCLEKRKKIELKNYSFQCPHSVMKADVKIEPIKTSKDIKGLSVTIANMAPCTVSQKLKNSQRLIDIGKTASTLAHGVRNPLNAIKGAVVYLSERYSNEPALLEFSGIIQDEISKLDGFISKFLSASLSELDSTMVDINLILKKIEVFMSLQSSAGNIKTSYDYGAIPHVMINPSQMEQAILNVMNNAIEAMPAGGRLSVKTYPENLSGNDFAVIEISDTGPGIPKNKINDLWGNCDKGRGFGLCITREILQHYNGNIEIKSAKGKGATLKLSLPCK